MTAVALGGPGAGCSITRVRRLLVNELSGAEREAMEAHLAGCARCQASRSELEAERGQLAQVPFEAFAAGVAEKMARATEGERPASVVSLAARRRWKVWGGVAFAASAAAIVVVTSTATFRFAEGQRIAEHIAVEHDPAPVTRTKGGDALSLELYALRTGRSFRLNVAERVQDGDRLLPVLPAPPRSLPNVVVALREGSEVHVLFRGPARAGPLPEAFEWTGHEPRAQLVALYSQLPVDEAALTERLSRGDRPTSDGTDVLVVREVFRRP